MKLGVAKMRDHIATLEADRAEAAERIKSLQAEVERLYDLAKANNALARHEAAGRREAEADRQRMREALEEAKAIADGYKTSASGAVAEHITEPLGKCGLTGEVND